MAVSTVWAAEGRQLLVADRAIKAAGHEPAILHLRSADPPLPELRAADLGRRRVLHEVVDRGRAVTGQPGVEVLERDRHVQPDAVLGDAAARHREIEQFGGRDMGVLAAAVLLVRRIAERVVEDLGRERNQVRMGHPGPVEPVARLALLVLADLRHRRRVRDWVAARRDERGHAADRVGPRRWQVRTSSSVYARMNGVVIVSWARSGRIRSGRPRNVLMQLNR